MSEIDYPAAVCPKCGSGRVSGALWVLDKRHGWPDDRLTGNLWCRSCSWEWTEERGPKPPPQPKRLIEVVTK